MSTAARFNAFLSSVDLPRYREKYSQIKLVELDMPKAIQAIAPLYQHYWSKHDGDWARYEEFYAAYSRELRAQLEEFRRQKMFSEETFYRGLPARIYRTWASLLTQIQGAYVAEEIYGRGNVEMSAELDYQGIDMRILNGGDDINIQIKKETLSREVRAPWHLMRRKHKITVLTYEVPGNKYTKKTGVVSEPYLRWEDKWRGKLERLPNGFIVFLPAMFELENITTP